MAATTKSVTFLPIALAILLSFTACIESRTFDNERKLQANETGAAWCIAKPSTDNERLHHNIDYSCRHNGVYCELIQPGGSCFHPDNAVSHASVAMNLYYIAAGKHPWDCHFNGSALIVTADPSIGNCIYPM
ncbi:glucan endo-1,3-beta-glucosidase 7-like [Rhodamnia argentea]|uniref:Glucan endo-1,3-beta-glucosidase 7-like n=1 Tax=Rhodamnia argentea TaxID=178133 RepID=A0A8B8PXZ0_9MYRT|nr:glucan endo-1,3-beta-glucosidase 7-like [Rhodamnia argentea]